jgi:hypothetical protein
VSRTLSARYANLPRLLLVLSALLPATAAAQDTSQNTSQNTSCRVSAGAQRAAEYVRQCRDVSPATHPPCNTDNACTLIIAEIRRGCALLGADAPKFCASYASRR